MPAGPWSCISFVPVTIHTEPSGSDLSRLRINRDAPPRLRWLPWVAVVVLAVSAAGLYPRVRALVAERQAPEVDVVRGTQIVTTPGRSTPLPGRVATAPVVRRARGAAGR